MLGGSSEKKKLRQTSMVDAAEEAWKAERHAHEAQEAVRRAQRSDGHRLEQAVLDARQAARRAEVNYKISRKSKDPVAIAKAEAWRQVAEEAAHEAHAIARLKGVNLPRLVLRESSEKRTTKRKRKKQWI